MGEYKGWPLYDARAVDALADRPHRPELDRHLAARQAWEAASVPVREACQRLVDERGWRWREAQDALTARNAIVEERVPHGELAAGLADDVLDEQVAARRLIGPEQAAAHLEIRRSDFDHLRRAGLARPADTVDVRIGRRWVTVPLFAIGDLDTLRADPPPGLDWEFVRGARPGQRSALLDML